MPHSSGGSWMHRTRCTYVRKCITKTRLRSHTRLHIFIELNKKRFKYKNCANAWCLARAAHIDCCPPCRRNHNKHTNCIWNRHEEQIKNQNIENFTKPHCTRESRTVCIWRGIVKCYLCVVPVHLYAGYSFHVRYNNFFSFHFPFLNFLFILFFEIRKNGVQALTHTQRRQAPHDTTNGKRSSSRKSQH